MKDPFMFFRVHQTDDTYSVDSKLEHFACTDKDQVALNTTLQFVIQYFVDGGTCMVEIYSDAQWSLVRPHVIGALGLSDVVLVSVFYGVCVVNQEGVHEEIEDPEDEETDEL